MGLPPVFKIETIKIYEILPNHDAFGFCVVLKINLNINNAVIPIHSDARNRVIPIEPKLKNSNN